MAVVSSYSQIERALANTKGDRAATLWDKLKQMHKPAFTAQSGLRKLQFHSRTPLAGNGSSTPWSAVNDELEINACILENGKHRIAILQIDALYIGHRLRDLLEEALSGVFAPQELFLAASHTHNAPMLDPTKPKLGLFSEESLQLVFREAYGLLIELADTKGEPVRLHYASATHSFGVSRRLRKSVVLDLTRKGPVLRREETLLAPNKHGVVDNEMHRISVKTLTGKSLAEIWSVAIHPTAFPHGNVVSGDFPSFVRKEIRMIDDSELPVIFLLGFSAEIRPKTKSVKNIWSLTLGRPQFRRFSIREYRNWSKSVAKCLAAMDAGEELQSNEVRRVRHPISRSDLFEGQSGPEIGFLHLVQLGNLILFGVPGEVASKYKAWISSTLSKKYLKFLGVSCIDHVWGYIPTLEMIEEGGYESSRFLPYFELSGVNPRCEGNLLDSADFAFQQLFANEISRGSTNDKLQQ